VAHHKTPHSLAATTATAAVAVNVTCVVCLQGPALERADTIIYCTGYRYRFPFLEQHPSTARLSGQQHVPGL
jgi:hypothetical protein